MRSMRTWALGAVALVASAALAQGNNKPAPNTPAPAAAITPALPAGAALTKSDVDVWLDGYMPYALRSGDIPGAVVTVVKDGQLLTARGFGYADVAKRTPVDPYRTLFRPGSVSKLVRSRRASSISMPTSIATSISRFRRATASRSRCARS